jgi:DNA-binding CsgD family transcriptional regulator/PAS domain-containing protein
LDNREEQLIGEFYQAVSAPEVWPRALERFRALFDAEAAILGIYDPVAHDISLSFSAGTWTREVMDRYVKEFVKVDPAIPKFAGVPTGKAVSTETLLSPQERRGSVFYNEFLRPLDLADCLGARLLDIDGGFSALAVHCNSQREGFSADDAATLERLVPHAARAFQLHRAFGLLNIKAALLSTVVDRLPVGLIASDRGRHTIHVNAAARSILGRKDGLLQDTNGVLRAIDRVADGHLLALQQAVRRGGAGGIVRVPREHTTHAYPVLVAPLPAGTGLAGAIGEGRSGALVLIHDPDTRMPTPTQTIAAMYGLSPRGAELAAALAAGEDLKEYAERAGISMHTARFHLKRLFATLGVRSQAELVRRMMRALTEFNLARRNGGL